MRTLWSKLRSRVRGLLPGHGPAAPRHGRDPLGPAAERLAARTLRRAGYRVLARNAVTPVGEADLVCLAPDRSTVVIVEVKARRDGSGDFRPENAVHHRKRATLRAVARALARANGWTDRRIRIDVIAIDWPDGRTPTVRHLPGAVQSQ